MNTAKGRVWPFADDEDIARLLAGDGAPIKAYLERYALAMQVVGDFVESAPSLFFPREDETTGHGLFSQLESFRLQQLISVGHLIGDSRLGISIDNIMVQMVEDQRSDDERFLSEMEALDAPVPDKIRAKLEKSRVRRVLGEVLQVEPWDERSGSADEQ